MKSVHKKWLVLFWAGLAIMLVSGCGGDDGPTDSRIHNNKLILDFYDTQPLPSPWLFQIWAFSDSGWNAGSAFNLAFIPGKDNRQLLDVQDQPITDNKLTFLSLDLTECDSLRVTLQQNVATDTASAGLVFLAAAIENPAPVLESPFRYTAGAGYLYFVFATPTDPENADGLSGIWFTGTDLESPGLDSLPDIPDGWIFEGWVYHDGYYLSTGKFSRNTGRDSSCTYYNCDAPGAPDFPGEDFLDDESAPQGLEFPFQLDNDGDTVMITIEPVSDPDESRPFIRWYSRNLDDAGILHHHWKYILGTDWANWPKVNAFIRDE